MKNFKEIQDAVDEGALVYWKNPAYVVRKRSDKYVVECGITGSVVPLSAAFVDAESCYVAAEYARDEWGNIDW